VIEAGIEFRGRQVGQGAEFCDEYLSELAGRGVADASTVLLQRLKTMRTPVP
jgi:hypothetical protein